MKPEPLDFTAYVGQLGTDCKWPMYSFDRPAYYLWQAIGQQLIAQGWTSDEVKTWLQSKHTRWALDMDLGDMLRDLGKRYARQIPAADRLP
jgi:hypothetical protein